MAYRVSEVARLSGLTVKGLHHYYKMGLFVPQTVGYNGYRLQDRMRDRASPVKSLGGFTVLPDYGLDDCPQDGTLVTANGTGYLEFIKEMLLALDAYPEDYVESSYQFFKIGYTGLSENQ